MKVLSIQLPSRGKLGPSHAKVSAPTVEHIREFLTFQGRHSTAINSLVESICDVGIGPLACGDRDYLFVNIRQFVNPAPFEGTYACSACGKTQEFSMLFSEIRISQLPDDFQNRKVLKFPSGEEFCVQLLTVDAEQEVTELIDLYQSSDTPNKLRHSDLGADLETVARFAQMLYYPDISLEDRMQKIRDMDFNDYQWLVLYDTAFSCGPKFRKEVSCSSCGHSEPVYMMIDSSFLGISIHGLIEKHRFLARVSSIGFSDFMKYTPQEADTVVKAEIDRIEKANQKIKRR